MSNVGERSSEVQALARVLQTATIPKAVLQAICSVNGISKAGTKADIQKRIIQRKYSHLLYTTSIVRRATQPWPGTFHA